MNSEIVNMSGYTVTQIADGVYLADEFGLATMFIVIGMEKALVIDCGTGVKNFVNLVVRGITKLPLELAVTHGHIDHVGGRGQFDSMYISKEDASLLERDYYHQGKRYLLMRNAINSCKIKPSEAEFVDYRREPELHNITGGDTINIGDRSVQVISMPGHTLGSVAFRLMPDNIVFTGDVLNQLNLMNLKGAAPVEKLKETFSYAKENFSDAVIWASHYHKPYSLGTLDDGLYCVDEVCKKKNSILPVKASFRHNTFNLIYRTDRIH